MAEAVVAPERWLTELPRTYRAAVVKPVRYETHRDAMAHAQKVVGLDAEGRRCYVRHLHTVVDQRFDIDEWPLEVPSGGERRVAWRLHSGRWLMLADRIDRLDSCSPRVAHSPPRELGEAELGM
jgi:hypothetical protein